MSNHCSGCRARILNCCSFTKYNDNGSCPCCKCVVKVICMNGCPTFSKYSRTMSDRRDQDRQRKNL